MKQIEFSEESLRKVTARFTNRLFQKRESSYFCEFIGCSVGDFRRHIESQFMDGMTWNNHGEDASDSVMSWEFDHIKPVRSFDLTVEDQFRECAHYTNIRPLWWRLNMLRVVPGLDNLSAVQLATLSNEQLAMRIPALPTVRNGKPCFQADLRCVGYGRIFGPSVEKVIVNREIAICPESGRRMNLVLFGPQEKPQFTKRNGTACWTIDLRAYGLGRLFAPTREAVILKRKAAISAAWNMGRRIGNRW